MAPPSRIFISKSMKGHLTPMTWKNSMINSGIIRRPVIQVMGYPLVMCWNSMMKQGVPFFYVDRYDFKRIDFTESQLAEEFIHTMQF